MDEGLLNHDEQTALAGLVRLAIDTGVASRGDLEEEAIEAACRAHPRLGESRGVFVTIYVRGELRGCLGEIAPKDSLAMAAAKCAGRAVYADWRFEPVKGKEMKGLTFKISVLTPPALVMNLAEIKIGRDGLIVRHAGRTGLLLPEVAEERGWDVRTFLRNLWNKAGIEAGVKLGEVELLRFESQLISGEE